jgi:hypothetical protein
MPTRRTAPARYSRMRCSRRLCRRPAGRSDSLYHTPGREPVLPSKPSRTLKSTKPECAPFVPPIRPGHRERAVGFSAAYPIKRMQRRQANRPMDRAENAPSRCRSRAALWPGIFTPHCSFGGTASGEVPHVHFYTSGRNQKPGFCVMFSAGQHGEPE